MQRTGAPTPPPPPPITVTLCYRAGLTPLQRACDTKRQGVNDRISDTASHVRLLLAARADVNRARSGTLPPLHSAVLNVNVDAVIALMSAEADPKKSIYHRELGTCLNATELAEKYIQQQYMREIVGCMNRV
jgi:hypothetical protein